MSRPAGIPLLSGPPSPYSGPSQTACRKCGREFNLLFNRQRKCMHCGYCYCSSCSDYQALMPRRGPAHGYDLAPVCAFCIEMLNVTALGRAQLRLLPLAKLRRYIDAYNIPIKNPIDKNDLVDAAVAARTLRGCLSPVNEDYYRNHSVPPLSTPGSSSFVNRNTSSRGFPNSNANNNPRTNRPFPRPDLDPNHRQRPQETTYSTYTPRPAQNLPRSRTTSAPINPGTTRPINARPDIPRPTSSAGQHLTPSATDASRSSPHLHTASPLPPPPMSTLVILPRSSLSALSVGTLKQILWEARVRIPPGIVEKEELVDRVWALVEEEKRKDDEGIDDVGSEANEDEIEGVEEPDREEEVVTQMVDPESEAHADVARGRGQGNGRHHAATDGLEHGHVESEMMHGEPHSVSTVDSGLPHSRPATPQPSTSPPNSPTSFSHATQRPKPRSHPKPTSTERSGLCVICQDEEACIAVVDCGHLAMCRECSDLVLASSRECPLCRTRIVTEARLLRIFKT